MTPSLSDAAPAATAPAWTRWSRDDMARRVARDIVEGMVVNLGIGLPTRVANHIPADREVLMHSENGVLGFGPAPQTGQEDYDLINAGKQPVTLRPGGVFFHHADSFGMMRGGHMQFGRGQSLGFDAENQGNVISQLASHWLRLVG